MPRAAESDRSCVPLEFDTSAWNRQRDPSVAPRWRATHAADLFAICPVVALELLAAARDKDALRRLGRTLSAPPQSRATRAACERAISAHASSPASDAYEPPTI